MSDSSQSMKTTPRKRRLDVDHYKEDARVLPSSPFNKSAQLYDPPSDDQIASIVTRINQPGYNGLNVSLLRGPHLVTGTMENALQEELSPVVNSDILECGDTSMLDPASHDGPTSREDNILRASLIIIVIHHENTDAMIGEFCIPSSVSAGEVENALRARIIKQHQNIQSAVGKFFLNLVKDTRQYFDGQEFDYAEPSIRQPIWVRIWDRAPYQTAKAMLGQCATVIDLDNIFFHKNQDEVRQRWQRMFKSEFVMGCQSMTENCPGPCDTNFTAGMLQWYRFWRELPNTTRWDTVTDLWKLKRLPVRRTPVKKRAIGRNERTERTSNRNLDDFWVVF